MVSIYQLIEIKEVYILNYCDAKIELFSVQDLICHLSPLITTKECHSILY